MAHGVEGRFPFLDHRLYEFAAALPSRSRMRGLREKDVLRRWAQKILSPRISGRTKQPYRAPDAPSFFGAGAPAWIADHLSPEAIRRVGVFSPRAVEGLVRRCKSGVATGFRENQSIVGVLSTQVWHYQFIQQVVSPPPLPASRASVLLDDSISVFS